MAINRIALGTRKGLLLLSERSDWQVEHEAFSGSHVSIVFLDKRSGHLYACLDDGHFGNKLFQWSNFSEANDYQNADPKEVWKELSVPKYPEGSKLPNGNDAVSKYLWAMSSGSRHPIGSALYWHGAGRAVCK